MKLYSKLKRTIIKRHIISITGLDNNIVGTFPILELNLVNEDYFTPSIFGSGIPGIIISNDEGFRSDDLKAVVLSHEYGHACSFFQNQSIYNEINDLRAKKYRDKKILSQKEAKIIYDEEVVAWKLGRQFLKEFVKVGDPIWKIFDKDRKFALKSYRDELGI